ncbi:MAG: Rieske 2Fe-2S domain-containing protein [Pseudomonadota bacterium]
MSGPIKHFTAPEGWYVVAKQSEIPSKKPIQRWLDGVPVVLYRSQGEIIAMIDRCPHRGARLSDGLVKEGAIECPYHGWRFASDGKLQHVPCLVGATPGITATRLQTSISRGLVFVAIGEPKEPPYLNRQFEEIRTWFPVRGTVKCDIADALENFLDPTHTIFVHRQLVRSVTNSNRTTVEITADSRTATARYLGEGQAGGLVGKLMNEQDRALSVGRFVGPNIAEVEFHGPKSVNFVMTGYMTPTRDGWVEGFGMVGLPGPKWWARLKFAFLYPWIRLVHAQDQKILQRTEENNQFFKQTRKVVGPLDVIRTHIDVIREGKRKSCDTKTRLVEMDL